MFSNEKLAVSYWLKTECGDLIGLVGGPKRGQVTALQRALLYLAFGYLGNRGAARRDSQTINVFERTEDVRVKKYTRNVGKPDSTVRTHYCSSLCKLCVLCVSVVN